VAEGATSNVFLVKNGELLTPALSVGILDGVTRGKVIQLARAAGIGCREVEQMAPDELRAADEAFLTSAARGVLPVVEVDGKALGDGKPGPVTQRVRKLYERLTEGEG
jgi:branched-chain amino acid aminotransferase